MAHEDEVSSNLDFYLSVDELYEALDEIMKEYKKLKKKSKETITSNQDLSSKLELVTKEKEDLIKENKKVNQKCDELEKHNINLTNELNATKKELDKTKPLFDKFTLSSQRLDEMIKNQRAVFDKAGLGYRCYDKQKTINNLYKKSSKENITYFHYGKVGHRAYTCKTNNLKVKQVWIIKGTHNSNPKGSKIA